MLSSRSKRFAISFALFFTFAVTTAWYFSKKPAVAKVSGTLVSKTAKLPIAPFATSVGGVWSFNNLDWSLSVRTLPDEQAHLITQQPLAKNLNARPAKVSSLGWLNTLISQGKKQSLPKQDRVDIRLDAQTSLYVFLETGQESPESRNVVGCLLSLPAEPGNTLLITARPVSLNQQHLSQPIIELPESAKVIARRSENSGKAHSILAAIPLRQIELTHSWSQSGWQLEKVSSNQIAGTIIHCRRDTENLSVLFLPSNAETSTILVSRLPPTPRQQQNRFAPIER